MAKRKGGKQGGRVCNPKNQPRTSFCDCTTAVPSKPEGFSHGRGKPESAPPSIDSAFLSIPISKLAPYVKQHNLPLQSQQAERWLEAKERRIELERRQQEEERAAAEEKQRVQELTNEKRRSFNNAIKSAPANAGFVTLKYGKSIGARLEVGSWPPHLLTHRAELETCLDPVLVTPAKVQLVKPTGPRTSRSPKRTADTRKDSSSSYHQVPIAPPTPTDSRRSSFSDMSVQPTQQPDTTGGSAPAIKDTIEQLFLLQQHLNTFRNQNQDLLTAQVENISKSLSNLQDIVSDPSNPLHNIRVAPEIIDYVDDGRNPDIFTRDFVELVQRGNAVVNGKQQAFRDFSKVYAQKMMEGFEGMDEEIREIMADAGMEERDGAFVDVGADQTGHGAGNGNGNGNGNGA